MVWLECARPSLEGFGLHANRGILGSQEMTSRHFGPRASRPARAALVTALVPVEVSAVRALKGPPIARKASASGGTVGSKKKMWARLPADQCGTSPTENWLVRARDLPFRIT